MPGTEFMNRTYASLILRGKDLNPQKVIESIGITPSRSFKRGDIRKGNKRWPHGYWELESTGIITSSNLSVHLEWLAEQIEPSKIALTNLLKRESIDAEISCFWILVTSHESLNLNSELLGMIASMGLRMSFDIYCPD